MNNVAHATLLMLLLINLNHGDQRCFIQFAIIINALSASFEYLGYGSAAIRHILLFQCGDRL